MEVFQDGKVVFVRHGGLFVCVYPNRLQKVNNNLTAEGEKEGDTTRRARLMKMRAFR